MKHIFITIILTFATISAYAQLNGVSHETAAGYKTIWEAPMGYGEIRYMESEGLYVLCGVTNNKFENSMATIVLGDSKESANLSLDDLHKICTRETKLPKGGLVVNGYAGKSTEIYFTMNGPTIKTEYIAGESFVLFFMKKKFDDAKNAINTFKEQ
jgi:hypothetical protein